jgi:hypothetical protein
MALGFNKNRPTGFETAQRIVQTAGNGHEFGRHRAIEVRPPEFCCALKRAVLVQDDAFIHKGSPRQKIRQTRVRTAIFGKVHHERAHVLR